MKLIHFLRQHIYFGAAILVLIVAGTYLWYLSSPHFPSAPIFSKLDTPSYFAQRYLDRPSIVTASSSAQAKNFPIQEEMLRVGSLTRSYFYYVPKGLPAKAPLLIVFHGSAENGQTIRSLTNYEFESLANSNKFVVVYPNGYKGNWNDCRISAHYPARSQNSDDEGFVKALITHFQTSNAIDIHRVFAAGYSNGGEMVYRLAEEMPDSFAGVAAIAANLPAPSNNSCHLSGKPLPILIMTGTKDPLDPYKGGIGLHGAMLSSFSSAQFFAQLDGQTNPPVNSTLPHQASSGSTSVTLADYVKLGKPEVEQYSIQGGGHVIPNLASKSSRRLGLTTHDIDAPAAIMNFFFRQSPSS